MNKLKPFFPYLLALAIFAGAGMIYFYPVLQGYKLKQGDIKLHKGMSQELRNHKAKFNEEPLWVGNMFSGMPAYQVSNVKYTGNIIAFFHQILQLGSPHPIGILILYMIGFYILLLCLRINPYLAIVGAIAFAFSSYFIVIIEAGHNSKAFAIAYVPPLLGGIIATLRGNWKIGILVTSIFMGLELYANHLQITYYALFLILIVGIGEMIHFIKSGESTIFFKRAGLVIIAVLLGILPNMGNILTTFEYAKSSTRSPSELSINPDGSSNSDIKSTGLDKDYITRWSYGIQETWSLMLPNVKGGKSGAILSDQEEMDRIRKENPNFFNFMVTQYQQSGYYVNTYWGNMPFTSGPVYIGIIVCFLAWLCLFFIKDRLVNSLVVVAGLCILLSWGKNFMGFTDFFIDHVPGYNKFRAVTMILSITELVLPLLAILFLGKLIQSPAEILKEKKKLFISGGVFLGILLLFLASPKSFFDFASDSEMAKFNSMAQQNPQQSTAVYQNLEDIESYRVNVFQSDVFNALKFLLVGIALIALFLMGKIKKQLLIIGFGALITIDLWSADKQYVGNEVTPGTSSRAENHYAAYTKPNKVVAPYDASPVDLAILNKELQLNQIRLKENRTQNNISESIAQEIAKQSKKQGRLDPGKKQSIQFVELMRGTHYRVLNTTAKLDEDAQTAYFHKTLGGYHGAKMKKYQELIDFEVGVEHYQLRQAFDQGGEALVKQLLPSMNGINMLNSKYIIGAVRVEGGQALSLVENPHRLGNAWFVNEIKLVESADEEILALRENDPKTSAVVRSELAQGLPGVYDLDPSASVNLTQYLPNYLSYEYKTNKDQFLVFSEIYYADGWNAYVNGEAVEHIKVNYILRGMHLAKGEGTIEFKFEPKTYEIGTVLTWTSSALMLLLIIGVSYTEFKKKTST